MEDQMQQVKAPTCGRIVHYFPKTDTHAAWSELDRVPAIVIMGFTDSLAANLMVFTSNPDGGTVSRLQVPHISEVMRNEDGTPANSYWA